MTTKVHEKLDDVETALLDIWRRRVDGIDLAVLRDYAGSSPLYHRLREMRDQVDVCLGNIDEIHMALYKPPFGIAQEDEED